ncbi:hypothetical protein EZS27_007141 [termite gut metagenome]|uniref:Uncharacterized protein n=1 Tax=termite gut metagenome TaxID=433724 RepID=A0A5J4SHC3_9ZZZZ
MKPQYILFLLVLIASCNSDRALHEAFLHPDNQYRPMPLWHINGRLTTSGIKEQLQEAKQLSGFGGVTVLPVSSKKQWGSGLICPGVEPTYLSDEYFDRYGDILELSKTQGTEVILYDEIDYPSGTAGGRLQKEYPEYTRKLLIKEEISVKGTGQIKLSRSDTTQLLMAVSAMNTATLEVLDLAAYMKNNQLIWTVPTGDWRIMFFNCKFNARDLVDYMQPEAVDKVMSMTYDEYGKRFGPYFGNVITKTFFDDVGFIFQEETWTPSITEIFRQKYGKNPALYYPALFYDIGAETQAARVAFYDIRSELMAEGYVKKVSEWTAARHIRSMGHPPENYSPNTVASNGDILKFYRHVQIPLTDAILRYGHGIHGFKQVSSAADRDDKPLVGAEVYGAFPAKMDSLTLYRTIMDVMARGVNFVVPHGMWYNPDPDKIIIPPLISHQNPQIGGGLPHYSTYIARCCMMLQGGARVSDIALLWPITAIQAESTIAYRNRPESADFANWTPPHVNHHVLSNLLTNELRRDFTFIHPEDLHNGKVTANGKELALNNATNSQHFKALLMPGSEVISVATLQAIRQYYQGGGKIIATELLPSKSAEFEQDEMVVSIIREIFGAGSGNDTLVSNAYGGQAIFIRTADTKSLSEALLLSDACPDV